MTLKQVLLSLSLVASSTNAFSPNSIRKLNDVGISHPSPYPTNERNVLVLSMSSISDAHALLAKARALREQAEADEHKLHSTLIEKKVCKDTETDAIIRSLFPLNEEQDGDAAILALSKRMEEKKLSTTMLKKVVERLHEREIAARGLAHVETKKDKDQVRFVTVAAPQEEELARVQGLTQRLIDAAEILDKEYLKNEKRHHHAVEDSHWSRGTLSKVLREKAHFLAREHDDEFKKRTKEYYEAARKKKDYDSYSM